MIEQIHNFGLDTANRTVYISSSKDTVDSGVDHRMAEQFIKNIEFLDNINNEVIKIVCLSSLGGDCAYGMGMFDAIARCKSPTHFYLAVLGCSMFSVLPQAATKRFISRNAGLMIHYTQGATGPERKFYLEEDKKMLELFAKRSSMTVAKLKKLIDKYGDWYLTAEEALKYGLVDEIY